MEQTVKFPAPAEIAGVVIALLPFVYTFSTSTSRTVNGVVVEESKTDYAAILLGALAVGMGIYVAMTLLGKTADDDRLKRYAAVGAMLVIGAFQLVRGFGMV